MKITWVLFIAIVTTNISQAKSLIDKVLENNIIESDVPKASNPTSYAITRRRNISLFLNRPHRENNFVVNLNPTVKTFRQTDLEKYRKPFMKKLLIKYINNKDNVKFTEEVTTRRSLMQRKNFTVRPRNHYAKTTNKKYNRNRNNSIFNLEKSKRETNVTIGKVQLGSEQKGSEKETQNFPLVNLNQTMKTVRQTELEKYRKPVMQKLLIKDVNNKHNIKATSIVTTRRSLMQRKNFTVRPYDVYAKTIHKKYNWNRNNSTYNLEKSQSEKNITKEKFQQGFEKMLVEESQNINRIDTSTNDHGFVEFEKQHINTTKHTHDLFGLRKPKTLLLFPKRNILNDLTENTLQLGSENETSNTLNDQNSNLTVLDDKENTTITPEIIIKSDSKDQLEEVKEPKEKTSDQEEKDREEFIYVREVNQNVVSNDNHDLSGNGQKTIGQRFRFYSFMKNKM